MKTGHMVKKTERGHCIANILSLGNTMDYKVHRWEGLYLIHDYSNENALNALKVIRRYIQT
jgi:hypothetical protein